MLTSLTLSNILQPKSPNLCRKIHFFFECEGWPELPHLGKMQLWLSCKRKSNFFLSNESSLTIGVVTPKYPCLYLSPNSRTKTLKSDYFLFLKKHIFLLMFNDTKLIEIFNLETNCFRQIKNIGYNKHILRRNFFCRSIWSPLKMTYKKVGGKWPELPHSRNYPTPP